MKPIIRNALPGESEILTALSFASKRVWNDPEAYFEIWKDELTITPAYILKSIVKVAESAGEILGYYSIVHHENEVRAGNGVIGKGDWLEHLFIKPEWIAKGIGSQLMGDVRKTSMDLGIKQLYIFSDPHAKGFYEKMGAEYIGESPSNIEGRTVALFGLKTL